jgi:Zn-dependent alcohol dehydrogenase
MNFNVVGVQVIAEMTNGGVDRAVECTGSVQAMISAFECVHDVCKTKFICSYLLLKKQ